MYAIFYYRILSKLMENGPIRKQCFESCAMTMLMQLWPYDHENWQQFKETACY